MQIDFAFLCDYADVSGAKAHALGIGIDTIFLPTAPGGHTGFWFVAALASTAAEVGQKQLEVKLMGPDGQDIVPTMGGSIVVGAPPVAGHPARNRIAVQFANVQFPVYGEYAVHLLINGAEMTAVRFRVAAPPTATTN